MSCASTAAHQQLRGKVVGQARGAEVVAAGLDGHAVAQGAEADLALKVLQRAHAGRRVLGGRHTLQTAHQRMGFGVYSAQLSHGKI